MILWRYAEVYKNTTPGYIQQLRYEIVTRRIEQGWSIRRICEYYTICRRTVYKWLGRFLTRGLEGLCDLSRTPKRIVGRVASWVEELIVRIRKGRPYLGPVRIHRQVAETTGYKLSTKTVHNVIVRNRDEIERSLSKRPVRRPNKYKKRKNQGRLLGVDEEWALDILFQGVKRHGWRRILVILDVASRRCVHLEQFSNITGLQVLEALKEAGRVCGLPRRIRTDNGRQFVCGQVKDFCEKRGIVHTTSRPGHPEENSVVERFMRTLREECLDLFLFKDPRICRESCLSTGSSTMLRDTTPRWA